MARKKKLPQLEEIKPVDKQCPHCSGSKLPWHPCPFAQEIYGEDDECECCDSCIDNCAMDI